MPVLLLIAAVAAWLPRSRADIGYGLAWWGLGLLPVLPLRNSAYPHYLYVALPGLALAVAGTLEAMAAGLGGRHPSRGSQPNADRPGRGLWPVIACVLALGYAARSEILVTRRFALHVEGADIPLDPQIRSMVIAGRAVYSLATSHLPPHTRLAILTPSAHRRVWGARTGRARAVPVGVEAGYDLPRAVLGDGRALRVFFPQVDSVIFVPRFSRALAGFTIATSVGDGGLAVYGSGLFAHVQLARDIAAAGDEATAREYMDSLRAAFPGTASGLGSATFQGAEGPNRQGSTGIR